MKRLKLQDLTVSTFEVETGIRVYTTDDPTPNTRCFDCIDTEHNCPQDGFEKTA